MKQVLVPVMLCLSSMGCASSLPAEGEGRHLSSRPVPRFMPVLPAGTVGINMHPERYGDPDMELHFIKARELGIDQIRVAHEWAEMEPQKGTWDFSKSDKVVALAKKYNMRILWVLCYNANWNAYVQGNRLTKPKDLRAWRAFVEEISIRYKGDIIWWEVWNEQNDFGLKGSYDQHPEWRWKDYRDIIQTAYEALKRVNPRNVVVFGGIGHSSDDWWIDLEEYYKAGAVRYCDVVAIHPYAGHVSPLDTEWYPRYIDEMLAVMARHGDAQKPVWITEDGYILNEDHPEKVTEAQQAEYLADLFLVALSRKQVEKVFWYALVDDQELYGLYRRDWTPRPAAERMKQLMNRR